jgi:hypothetical protein
MFWPILIIIRKQGGKFNQSRIFFKKPSFRPLFESEIYFLFHLVNEKAGPKVAVMRHFFLKKPVRTAILIAVWLHFDLFPKKHTPPYMYNDGAGAKV